jgi:nicotinamidase-related amidase/type 1 glutamine amidotransferase
MGCNHFSHETGSAAMTKRWAMAVCVLVLCSVTASSADADKTAKQKKAAPLKLQTRLRVPVEKGSGLFRTVNRTVEWSPKQTAIIVCDMWDLHHCLNATRRGGELVPRMNQVLTAARKQGITIIHAPSGCTTAYENHPARQHAQNTPRSENLPKDIGTWCHVIPEENKGVYPIDQTDGGEDDDLFEHRQWAARLTAMGKDPLRPWTKQTDGLTILDDDYISDNGEEIWSIMETRGIENVVLLGVHTNMCVLGRPFGLRQMAQNGKNVVLMRDMTDTMYNPAMKPFVSHFTGTDLIVEHIEKHVCPTITSTCLLGGKPFRFQNDKRPHLVIVIAEREYRTNESLPPFALAELGRDFKVSYVYGDPNDRNNLPGIEILDEADIALISVRRRVLPQAQMDVIRRFVESGKPVLGIRTASHALSIKDKPVPEGYAAWNDFDANVIGGNYTGHHGAGPKVTITTADGAAPHAILKGVDLSSFVGNGSLYTSKPLRESTQHLLTGTVEGHEAEPIAWTNIRTDGGRTFYTSLGHIDDFKQPAFRRLLTNAVYWAAGLEVPAQIPTVKVSQK